eukprot:137158_1
MGCRFVTERPLKDPQGQKTTATFKYGTFADNESDNPANVIYFECCKCQWKWTKRRKILYGILVLFIVCIIIGVAVGVYEWSKRHGIHAQITSPTSSPTLSPPSGDDSYKIHHCCLIPVFILLTFN